MTKKRKKLPAPLELTTYEIHPKGFAIGSSAQQETCQEYAIALMLPQERALCQPERKKRKGFRKAHITELLSGSPHRVPPRCPYYGYCGGCQLQHSSYSYQTQWKKQLLENQFNLKPIPLVPSPQDWNYRSKVEFSFYQFHDELRLGYHKAGQFNWVIQTDDCAIGPPGLRPILSIVRDWAQHYNLSGWAPKLQTGLLRYLVVRYSYTTQEFMVTLVSGPSLSQESVHHLAEQLSKKPTVSSFIWATQTSVAGAVQPDTEHLLFGPGYLVEQLIDTTYHLSWRSFFQANPPAYTALLQKMRAKLKQLNPQSVCDLYCGIGSIGLTITPKGTKLIGIESVPEAIEDAKKTAARLGRSQAQFFCQPAETWTELNHDLVIIDPPRSGCHPKMIRNLIQAQPKDIFYVSCNYRAFLQEWEQLKEHYRIVDIEGYDFFPHTKHVEVFMHLQRF